jgi:membrane associated rhomboid family serine protease
MFPIRDHNPSDTRPIVTGLLIAANVLIFLSYYGLFSEPRELAQFYHNWAMIPARISSGDGWQTLISSMFMHGGWMHLGGNILFLWIFGDNLEDEFGHIGFLIFYLSCGILASLAQIAAAPSSVIPTVGASGAIAGVMGAYLLLYPKARIDVLFIFLVFFRVLPIPAWAMLGLWFGFQLFSGLGADISNGGVAYWAHAGGFLAGFVLVLPLWLRRGGTGYWKRNQGHAPHADAHYSASRIPRVKGKS